MLTTCQTLLLAGSFHFMNGRLYDKLLSDYPHAKKKTIIGVLPMLLPKRAMITSPSAQASLLVAATVSRTTFPTKIISPCSVSLTNSKVKFPPVPGMFLGTWPRHLTKKKNKMLAHLA